VMRIARMCAIVLGVGLLLDGLLRLVITTSDWRENVLHVVTGLVLLAISFIGRELQIAWAAALVGALYVALGVVGLTIDQPFGLQLGPAENAFHIIVGLLALALGGWALRTTGLEATRRRTAAPPVQVGNAQASRRRARHRPGKVRGRPRRH
jgi:hypothetical protein